MKKIIFDENLVEQFYFLKTAILDKCKNIHKNFKSNEPDEHFWKQCYLTLINKILYLSFKLGYI